MTLTFHNHTEYSWDCRIKLNELEQRCIEQGIDTIAITDHNTIKGAQLAAEQFRQVSVIVGEEVSTNEGEIVGLFLTKSIKPGQSFAQTVDAIHEQGGITVAVHPFDRLRRHVTESGILTHHVSTIDIVEVFNSRTVFAVDNTKAEMFANQHSKPTIVGNDAHILSEIGFSMVKMPAAVDASSFLTALARAEFITHRAPLWVHGVTKVTQLMHYYRGVK